MFSNRSSSVINYICNTKNVALPGTVVAGHIRVLPDDWIAFSVSVPGNKSYVFRREAQSRGTERIFLGKILCLYQEDMYIFQDNQRYTLYVQNRTDSSYTFMDDEDGEEPEYTIVPPRSFVPVTGKSVICSDHNDGLTILGDEEKIGILSDNTEILFTPCKDRPFASSAIIQRTSK